jgi:uncharacterized protein
MSELKELVEYTIKAIVDKPENVEVKTIEGETSTILELKVAKEDMGKVIGKKGRTITALRTILSATRTQKDKRQILEILE